MHTLDWLILSFTLLAVIAYGVYKSNATKNLDGYFRGNQQLPWYLVLLGIMGTQASAITFISAPGQAYNDGLRFLQYYFGLPLAMVVICITFVPKFRQLNIYTAYEYLENRFDKKTRTFAALIFLLGRGLSTGISIVAPSIIIASLLGINLYVTNIVMGGLLIIYTVLGGAKAVAYTQQLQFIIIIAGMGIAGYYAVHLLPAHFTFSIAWQLASDSGKTNIITTGVLPNGSFNWNDKFNIWSGVFGGFFLALSYFGTDQSQVGRYIAAKSVKESRVGLILNGLFKIPMQFLILLVGLLVFSFYKYNNTPINFNKNVVEKVLNSSKKDSAQVLINTYNTTTQNLLNKQKNTTINSDEIAALNDKLSATKLAFNNLAVRANSNINTDDTNYIFLTFITTYLPIGLVGLLIAMLFLAAWGSIAAALNALSSSTIIDIHNQYNNTTISSAVSYRYAKYYTLAWGIFCIIAAQFATNIGSLIVAVNIIGSLFYGVMLGLFLAAFYLPYIKATAVFIAALLTQLGIFFIYFIVKFEGFLWLNVIGVALLLALAFIIQLIKNSVTVKQPLNAT